MKKFTLSACSIFILGISVNAQVTNTATPASTPKQDDFDKKHRFGIRVTPQPTWFKSNNTSSTGDGAYFGFGFGLAWEIKLSNIIRFSTGIGGDFEGGRIAYRYDQSFNVKEVIDSEGVLVEAEKGVSNTQYDLKNGNTLYTLRSRDYRTTMVTIPLILKMMTNEYSGLRYFAMFGGELGIRAAVKSTDHYHLGLKATTTANGVQQTAVSEDELEKTSILLGKDASLLPFRVGMNLGLGTEYRVAGNTSLVFSVNYFQSFTNLMRKESKFITKEQTLDTSTGKYTFAPLNQSYLMRAVRINIAIMF